MKEVRNIPKAKKDPDRVPKSFYVNAAMNKALKYMAADQNKTERKIVNEALEAYVPKKYLDMAQK